ncbi:50S ribosomal protein P1 [Candidatus Micrarchaeota archaeon]|jgi:ribosomal protein L12E/L44/L45/RPP1/RPP2|nr:50S ribosomal protein P1 [Candidatus Micrarchaeota archaeon]
MTKIDPYLHAALLLKGAEKDITDANILAVLKAAGTDADAAKAKVLADAVKDVNWDDALKAPAMAVAAAPAAPVAAAVAAAPVEDDGKKEEEAAAGLAGLFG